jgi:hypothetical protein
MRHVSLSFLKEKENRDARKILIFQYLKSSPVLKHLIIFYVIGTELKYSVDMCSRVPKNPIINPTILQGC